jgi:hypothetical protein
MIYIVEHTDGCFTFWIDRQVINRVNPRTIKKIFEVEDSFSVGELLDYVATKETRKMKEVI